MIDGFADPDAAPNLLERRWFSSITAVRNAQTECEVLREVMQLAETAWRRARSQLAELESLRDALGNQLALSNEQDLDSPSKYVHRQIKTAAQRFDHQTAQLIESR